MFSDTQKRELLGLALLALTVFLVLSLIPPSAFGETGILLFPSGNVMGALGAILAEHGWRLLGVGLPLLPLIPAVAGAACFGWIGRASAVRWGLLVTGLAILVPTGLAVLAVGAPATGGGPVQGALGDVPGSLGFVLGAPLAAVLGWFGAVLVVAVLLVALSIATVGWNPGRTLAGGGSRALRALGGAGAGRGDGGAAAYVAMDSGSAAATAVVEPETEPRGQGGGLSRLVPRRKGSRKAGAKASVLHDPGDPDSTDRPPLSLLPEQPPRDVSLSDPELERVGDVLIDTLRTFKVEGEVVGRTTGPVITQYEVVPAPGIKVNRIAALDADLALALKAPSVRIVAPIPGKGAVGVEVPNPRAEIVYLRPILESSAMTGARVQLPLALGRDLTGRPYVADLARMPHLLIAGATGSGKSVCINTVITSLIYGHSPQSLRLLLVDPKMVELSMYADLPHLRHPVVTDPMDAATVLKWAVLEMERRYALLSCNGVRSLGEFNGRVRDGQTLRRVEPLGGVDEQLELAELESAAGSTPESKPRSGSAAKAAKSASGGGRGAAVGRESGSESASEEDAPDPWLYTDGPLPNIVIVVDELADLMMAVQAEIERPLTQLAQKARAIGIHLIVATQRPSVNVITGLIKANFPCRIAFRVSSKVDSRTILDQNGADALLGNGDMLFLPPVQSDPVRLQGAFISTEDTERLMAWYRERTRERPEAEDDILEVVRAREAEEAALEATEEVLEERDALFRPAAELCVQFQQGSTSLLQRRLRIGYGRAARIVDQLHHAGILGPPDGSKPREVLVGLESLDAICGYE